jgi:hypothetical protein
LRSVRHVLRPRACPTFPPSQDAPSVSSIHAVDTQVNGTTGGKASRHANRARTADRLDDETLEARKRIRRPDFALEKERYGAHTRGGIGAPR